MTRSISAVLEAACGIAAPVCFVGAWVVAGAAADGYSPVHDAVSELARVGAPTQPVMTAGLVGFGVLAPLFGRALGRALGSTAVRISTATAGLATLGVAALPLGGPLGDGSHAVAAGLGYAGMAASPLLAAPHLPGRWRAASRATGTASAVMLITSTLGHGAGALQRAGLGVVDAWLVAMAIRELRR